MDEKPPDLRFLILGTARSGTTLVQRLCCELPDVWVPRESHFWNVAEEIVTRFEFPVKGARRRELVDWTVERLSGWNLDADPEAIMQHIHRRKRGLGLFTLFEALVASLSPERPILGEKTPNHIAWWELLTRAQENLKLIFVVRDPRAVLLSQRSVPWGERDAFAFSERWLLHQRSVVDARRLLHPSRVLVIRYEDLVQDPEEAQIELGRFLETTTPPSDIPQELLEEHGLFLSKERWKERSLGTVTSDRLRTWENGGLSDADIATTEATCSEMMARFSYPVASSEEVPEIDPSSLASAAAYRRSFLRVSSLTDLPIY